MTELKTKGICILQYGPKGGRGKTRSKWETVKEHKQEKGRWMRIDN